MNHVPKYGSPNVAILSQKKYMLSEENNQCSVIKFLFFVNNVSCKVKKENLFQEKKEIIFY